MPLASACLSVGSLSCHLPVLLYRGSRQSTCAYGTWHRRSPRDVSCKHPSTTRIAVSYDPTSVETGWYDWWESMGHLAPSPTASGPRYTMLLPPPNITGALHVGHALTTSIQDALVRWRRMHGDRVLWIPGLDHAGIATQVMVEKKIQRERGLSRHDLGRQAFLTEVEEWSRDYGTRILGQQRRLGASLDWSRTFYTMDPTRSKAVTEAFIRLYDAGFIYRATRLVNWCPFLKTVISDIEIDYETLEKAARLTLPGREKPFEFGVLYTIAYPVEDGGTVRVSTTRPETMLADAALAIHPDDARYKWLHGKYVIHPFRGTRLPVVLDSILVDPEMGTGVVKVTPAHDPDDLACGRRHGLPEENMLNDDGTLNHVGGRFANLDRLEARFRVLEDLDALGLYYGKQNHTMRVARCSRSKDVLEMLLKPQWFVRCEDLGRAATSLIEQGKIEILPVEYRDTWNRWMDGIHDWCISRQLWWGHRIPVYRIITSGDEEHWVAGRDEKEAITRAAQELGMSPGTFHVYQDEDVLDTWFSSALLPLSALGWPEQTTDSERFPLSLMETGSDILFFWVARMIMLCSFLEGRSPFPRIYLHPVVRDSQGRKMSKSLGNVVDPVHIIDGAPLQTLQDNLRVGDLGSEEVKRATTLLQRSFPTGMPECGADALRFSLVDYTAQSRQINLDVKQVYAIRRFCNKMWQATRFSLQFLVPTSSTSPITPWEEVTQVLSMETSLADKWIMSRLATVVKECDMGFRDLRLHSATEALRVFFYEFCDWYIEFAKGTFKTGNKTSQEVVQRVLWIVLDTSFRLFHPFMPFITEELWHHLSGQAAENASLMMTEYPNRTHYDPFVNSDAERTMGVVLEVIHTARSLRRLSTPRTTQMVRAVVWVHDPELRAFLLQHDHDLCRLCGVCEVDVVEHSPESMRNVLSQEVASGTAGIVLSSM